MLKQKVVILMLSVIVAAQSNLELSEIETNPIPTVVNFDGFTNTEEQPSIQSNIDFIGSVDSTQQFDTVNNDPNNFFLDNGNQNIQMNSEGNYDMNMNMDVNQNIDMNMDINQNMDMNMDVNQKIEMNADGNYENQGFTNDMSLNTIDTPQTQNWSQTDVNIQENSQDCIIIYSQCHYKGESQQLCQSSKNIDNFEHDIKSVYVPKGYVVRLYNKEDYMGEKVVLKESQDCLNKPLSLMQLFGRQTANYMILAQNANLRAI